MRTCRAAFLARGRIRETRREVETSGIPGIAAMQMVSLAGSRLKKRMRGGTAVTARGDDLAPFSKPLNEQRHRMCALPGSCV